MFSKRLYIIRIRQSKSSHLNRRCKCFRAEEDEQNRVCPELIDPCSIDTTTTGHLIVSCNATNSVYAIHSSTGRVQRIAGPGAVGEAGLTDGRPSHSKFNDPAGVVVIENEGCIYVADKKNDRIRRIPLPPL